MYRGALGEVINQWGEQTVSLLWHAVVRLPQPR